MKKSHLAAAFVLLAAMASCDLGYELQNHARSQKAPTQINFLFSDSTVKTPLVTQIPQIPAPASGDAQTARNDVRHQTSTPATKSSTTTMATVATKARSTDLTAADLSIPLTEMDPSLRVFDQNSDPTNHVSPELIAESDLTSFYITAGRRDPEAGPDMRRPVQVIERLFLHATESGAALMYERILNKAVPSFANAALDVFRQTYPEITPSSRMTDQFSSADQNHLVELRIDSETSQDRRSLKDEDPHIYYLLLREGRVTALFEFLYLSPQDPASVTASADQFVTGVKHEFSEQAASNNG